MLADLNWFEDICDLVNGLRCVAVHPIWHLMEIVCVVVVRLPVVMETSSNVHCHAASMGHAAMFAMDVDWLVNWLFDSVLDCVYPNDEHCHQN